MIKNNSMTIAQKIKLQSLLPYLHKKHKILDLGCGSMWLTKYLRRHGYSCTGFAIDKPTDILGDVKTYPFKKNQYDVVIALEMIEHVDCFKEIKKILKPNGLLILSSPVPYLDWLCLLGEKLGIFQPRETPHSNLFYLHDVPFTLLFKKTIFIVVQFGVFQKK